jgi:NADPH:quinone reductase-like Zn-dependent oxidoreductase
VRFHEYGDPDVLRYEDVQVPVPGPGEVRIRVASTAFIDDFGVAAASERVGNRSQAAWHVIGLTSARLRGVQA